MINFIVKGESITLQGDPYILSTHLALKYVAVHHSNTYVDLTSLLTQLLKKRNFQWTNRAEHTFQHLKEKMSSTSLFVLSNFSMSFKLMTDASNNSVGTTLI